MWRRWLTLVPGLALLLAACGGGAADQGIASLEDTTGDEGSTTTAPAASTDPEQAFLDFAQCMRDHGIDMPDPQMGPGGGAFGFTIQGEIGEVGEPATDEMRRMQEADEACRHFLEGIVQEFQPPDMSAMQDQMLAFSQCMRDHGIDMPDPVFSEDGGATLIGPDEGGGPAFDPMDPEFQAAQEACQEVFGGAGGPMVIIGGTGSSSGVVGPIPPPDGGDKSGG